MAKVENPRSPLVTKLQGMHLFHFDGAPCAQRVRFALGEKGIKRGREVRWDSDRASDLAGGDGRWVSRIVSLIKRHHLTEGYAAIHPNMVVPALVHDGQLIIESMDIVRYLDERFEGEPLIPMEPERREDALRLVQKGKDLHVSVRYVAFRWSLGKLAVLRAREEERLRRFEHPDSPERLAAFYEGYDRGSIPEETYIGHLRALEQAFSELEEALASDGRRYLTGETFTMADIIWSIKLLRLTECGYPMARDFPRLSSWFDEVSRRPAFQESVMGKHRLMSGAFRFKARVDALLGGGIERVSMPRPAA